MNIKDVAIIGAGPTGLFAGFYAGMRGLSSIIIDKLEIPGGQLKALYPEKFIYDIAGFKEIKAGDLVDNLLDQLSRFEDTTSFSLGNDIISIDKNSEGIFEIVGSKETILAKTIIIAAGNGAFAPRKIGLEGEDNFENINYFVDNMSKFDNKDVAIFGGGDSAVDWSLMLENSAKSVSIIHRRDEFRAHDHSVNLLKESKVNVYTPFTPQKLHGTQNITSIDLKKNKSEEIINIKVDEVICNFGFISSLGNISNWGLELQTNKIVVNSEQKTNIQGVFAIGDICTYPGKAALIINGMGEAPIAINSAYKTINPNAVIGTLHSSSVIGGH